MTVKTISIVKFVGYALFATLFYAMTALVLMAFAFLANQQGTPYAIWPISSYQQYIYSRSTRNIWQYQKDCISVDQTLIYAPAHGTCTFSNIEFDTILTFDKNGRNVPARPTDTKKPGIAVLGDSHAMGWGVNDDETFANILQMETDKPVYNLAVSSYGTQRELRRLVHTGLIDKVDTIIIQYCDNDLGENISKIDFEAEAAKFAATLESSIEPSERTFANHLASILTTHALRKSLTIPFRPIRAFFVELFGIKAKNFSPHFDALSAVFRENEAALAGKQILIFYSNAHGKKFDNFEEFSFDGMRNVKLIDLDISRDQYFLLDDHLNAEGHRHIGTSLAKLVN